MSRSDVPQAAVPASARRHALVTGAGRGIGAAIARRLAADGARLTLLGRSAGPLEALAAELPRSAGVRIALADVGDPASLAAAWPQDDAPDLLINNAGQAESAPFDRTTDELWQRMLAVNLSGTFFGCRLALPAMTAAGFGRIVNVASTAGLRGYAYVSAYVAAKHGVVGLTRALALEVATRGITVNAVCPGYTETDLLTASVDKVVRLTGRSAEQARSDFARGNPQRRFVQPEEVAATVAFLCSDAAASINGQALSVCGGETA